MIGGLVVGLVMAQQLLAKELQNSTCRYGTKKV